MTKLIKYKFTFDFNKDGKIDEYEMGTVIIDDIIGCSYRTHNWSNGNIYFSISLKMSSDFIMVYQSDFIDKNSDEEKLEKRLCEAIVDEIITFKLDTKKKDHVLNLDGAIKDVKKQLKKHDDEVSRRIRV